MRNIGALPLSARTPSSKDCESIVDSTDFVVDPWRTIQRNNYVVEIRGHAVAYFLRSKPVVRSVRRIPSLRKMEAHYRELRVHKWLTAGKYNPSNSQAANGIKLGFQIAETKFLVLPRFPNVTHNATAVAGAVRMHHENRQRADDLLRRYAC